MHSTKNVKEILTLVFAIARPIIKEIGKDGFQFTDLLSFMGDEEFKKAIGPAFHDISEVPSEIVHLSFEEGLELGSFTLAEVSKLFSTIE